MSYNQTMGTKPMPLRFEPDLHKLLREGVQRTPHKKQELIRLTLRRYLQTVIEEESAPSRAPLTRLAPWRTKDLEAAYQRVGSEWDTLENAAMRAQGTPNLDD